VALKAWGCCGFCPTAASFVNAIQPSPLGDLVESLMFDHEGRLWIAHRGGAGLIVFQPESTSSFAGSENCSLEPWLVVDAAFARQIASACYRRR